MIFLQKKIYIQKIVVGSKTFLFLKQIQQCLFCSFYTQIVLIYDNRNVFSFWYDRVLLHNLKNKYFKSWLSELLVNFYKNNTFITFYNTRHGDPLFKIHYYEVYYYRVLKRRMTSFAIVSFWTGRLDFNRNQKKTIVAIDATLYSIFWILSKYQKLFIPILFRFASKFLVTTRHDVEINRFFFNLKGIPFNSINNSNLKIFFGISEPANVGIGFCKTKNFARKRVRYSLGEFNLVRETQLYI